MLKTSRNYLNYKQISMVLIGSFFYGLGINKLQIMNYGMGSFDTLTLQLVRLSPIKQFGNASFLIHFIFFLMLLLLMKKYELKREMIVLSLFSIFILTRVVNVMGYIMYPQTKSIFSFIITFLILNLGLFLLAKSNLIIAPFDKFLVETANYFKFNFGLIRIIADFSLLLLTYTINWLTNDIVPITIFTLVITFFTGINMSMYELICQKSTRK